MTLHKLEISCPDGIGCNTTVKLDGNIIYLRSLKLELDAEHLTTATLVIDGACIDFHGQAEIVSRLLEEQNERDERPGDGPSQAD